MKKLLLPLLFCMIIALFSADDAHAEDNTVVMRPEHSVPVVSIETANGVKIGRKKTAAYVQVTLSITDQHGELILLDEFAAARVRGNSTSTAQKKAYNIKLSESADLFGMGSASKWALLANAYDKTLLRNKLAYDFAGELGLEGSPKSCFVDLYLNGKYLGCYQLTQTIEMSRSCVDLHPSKDEFILEIQPREGYSCPVFLYTPRYNLRFGLDGVDILSDEQRESLTDFLLQAETALSSGEEAQIRKYFDIDSFLDANIVHEVFKNIDVASSSTRFYIKDGVIFAGPVWDFDLSCGNTSDKYYKQHNEGDYTLASPERWFARCLWWKPLFNCGWFEQAFADRYRELQPLIVNLYEDNELGISRIDRICASAGECIAANFEEAGWSISKRHGVFEREPDSSYAENLEFLREWLRQRNQWILDNLS